MRQLILGLVALAALSTAGVASAEEPPPQYLLEWQVPHLLGLLGAPWNLTVDAEFNVLVTQTQPNQLDWYSTAGEPRAFRNLSAGGACASYPGGISVGPDGSIYVAVAGCSKMVRMDRTLNATAIWGGVGTGNGQFIVPFGVAAAPSGSVFVADTYNNRIQKFDAVGNYLSQWGRFGTAPGEFQNPFALACDANGDVYVMDTNNHRIQVFDGSGAFKRLWEVLGDDYHQLQGPAGMALDRDANVYVADTYNHRVVKFDRQGQLLSRWGTYGFGRGEFVFPRGVGVDDSGNVYVADTGNGRIQKFAPVLEGWLRVEPRVIQLMSSGEWLSAVITPPAPYPAAEIDVLSLKMNGVAVDLGGPVVVGDADGDGRKDLAVKFGRDAIVATRPPGTILPLFLTGLVSGSSFTCRDTVRLVSRPMATALPLEGSTLGARESDSFELSVRQIPARQGTILAQVRLPQSSREPAQLSLFDVRGRRLEHLTIDAAWPGWKQVALTLPREHGAGIYLIRLSQGANVSALRIPVIP